MEIKQEPEILFLGFIRKLFKKKKLVTKGNLGVYHDVLSIYSSSETVQSSEYDIFVKVKAVEVFENLVEVQILDVQISESVSQDIVNIIKSSIPKYVKPNNVSWQLN